MVVKVEAIILSNTIYLQLFCLTQKKWITTKSAFNQSILDEHKWNVLTIMTQDLTQNGSSEGY